MSTTAELLPARLSNRSWARRSISVKARGSKLGVAGRADTEFSERAVGVCEAEWQLRAGDGVASEAAVISTGTAEALARCSEADQERLTPEAVDRVCRRLGELGARWQKLQVGQSLLLEWS